MYQEVKKLLEIIGGKRRRQLTILILLTILSIFAEMIIIGVIVPLVSSLASGAKNDAKVKSISELPLWNQSLDIEAIVIYFGIGLFVSMVLKSIVSYSALKYSFNLGGDLSVEVYSKSIRNNYTWHAENNSSDILSIMEKVGLVVNGFIVPMIQGIVSAGTAIGILIFMVYIQPKIAIPLAIIFSTFYLVTSKSLARVLKRNGEEISAAINKRIKMIQESLGVIKEIKLERNEFLYIAEFEEREYRMRKMQAINGVLGVLPKNLVEAIGLGVLVSLAYLFRGDNSETGESLGIIAAFAVGMQRLLPQMQALYSSWASMKGNIEHLKNIINLISSKSDCESKQSRINTKVKHISAEQIRKIQIKFDGVSFAYPRSDKKVFEGVNFTLERGEIIGIVGPTGAGKSTFVDLLMGLLDPTSGEIVEENVIAKDKRLLIAHVPQSIYLFDSSILKNITFESDASNVDVDRLFNVMDQALVSEFIKKDLASLMGEVGERGVRLSGGQRQRIGIARALYKGADILVLDEATSALDAKTEMKIIEQIHCNDKECTIIMIAHRLATLKYCERILVVDKGEIKMTDYQKLTEEQRK